MKLVRSNVSLLLVALASTLLFSFLPSVRAGACNKSGKKPQGCSCTSSSQCQFTCQFNGRGSGSCTGSRRLALVKEDEDKQGSGMELQWRLWEEQQAACQSATYALAVSVEEGHISLMALPHPSDSLNDSDHETGSCLPLLFHDRATDGDMAAVASNDDDGKQVLVAAPGSAYEPTFYQRWQDSFFLDYYTGEELMQAFAAADSIASQGYQYHIIDHNCATFVLSMAQHLGYAVVAPDVIDYVVGRLAYHSAIPAYVRAVSDQKVLASLLNTMTGTTKTTQTDDVELMQGLVERYIRNFA